MTHTEFGLILQQRILKMQKTLEGKAAEYATEDRLHNFKEACKLQNNHPAQALLGMLAKHWVSIQDLVGKHTIAADPAVIDEKIGDAINYLVLLEALLLEKK